MAVAFIFEVDAMTADQYDGIMAEMGLGDSAGFSGVNGVVAHIAGPKVDGGWRVVDIWESEEAANAFYGSDQFAPVRAATESTTMSSTPWPLHRIDLIKP